MLSLGRQRFNRNLLSLPGGMDIFDRGPGSLMFAPDFFSSYDTLDMGPRMSVLSQQPEGSDYVVRIATPGMRREDLTINVNNNTRFITVAVQVNNNSEGFTSQSSAQTNVYIPSFIHDENGGTVGIDIRELQDITYRDGVLVARIPTSRENFELPSRRELPIRFG
tara:strand:- start:82 stop:576 length:495 start_codon:yes stop_codon:yes gene_type:complete